MMHSWQWVLDQLFPPRDTELRLREPYQPADYYRLAAIGDILTLSDYRDPVVQAAVIENKFWANDRATHFLASLLAHWLPPEPITIVPVPLSPQRQRERGYNQVERVIGTLGARPVHLRRALARTRHTPPQMDLPRKARLQNLTGAFAGRTTRPIETTRVVLLDDVLTTGATIRAARTALIPTLPPHTTLTAITLAYSRA